MASKKGKMDLLSLIEDGRVDSNGKYVGKNNNKIAKKVFTTFRLDKDFRDDLKVWCIKNNYKMSEAVQFLISPLIELKKEE